MPIDFNQIDTIVILMMENRSFDHMYGYLSTPGFGRTEVEGLRSIYSNSFKGQQFSTFRAAGPNIQLPADPLHERDNIGVQLGPYSSGSYAMSGFVENLAKTLPNFGPRPFVMGYWDAYEVPTFQFFSEQFAICDHWFSAIPAGTQPNRLMAMSGFTNIDINHTLIPDQELVYDWLTNLGIRWRVYHHGFPFFTLMPRMMPDIALSNHFRRFEDLERDIANETDTTFPQVIFIEPSYTDGPHPTPATDDHAPSPVTNGQHFMAAAYRALITNQDRWKKTVMIVTYDEHGGFFDHVSPPNVITMPPPNAGYRRFESLGVRVPGIVVSPLVEKQSVYKDTLDHTSILKFLGEKFNGGNYSDIVDARQVNSVSEVLTLPVPRDERPPEPPVVAISNSLAGYVPGARPNGNISVGFTQAVRQFKLNHPAAATAKFGDVFQHFPDL